MIRHLTVFNQIAAVDELFNRTAKAAEIKMFFLNEANELEEFSLSPVALFSVEQAKVYPNIKAIAGKHNAKGFCAYHRQPIRDLYPTHA